MLKIIKYLFKEKNEYSELYIQYTKDRKIVKNYLEEPYPRGLHDVGLYEFVDYNAGFFHSFVYYPTKKLNGHFVPYNRNNREMIEQKILLYNYDDLNEYYKKMIISLRILKKYYNEDGTLKDNNPFKNNDEVSE